MNNDEQDRIRHEAIEKARSLAIGTSGDGFAKMFHLIYSLAGEVAVLKAELDHLKSEKKAP